VKSRIFWIWSEVANCTAKCIGALQLLKQKTEVLAICTGLPGCVSIFSFSVDIVVTAATITTAAVGASSGSTSVVVD
jgi:hypothetical protein